MKATSIQVAFNPITEKPVMKEVYILNEGTENVLYVELDAYKYAWDQFEEIGICLMYSVWLPDGGQGMVRFDPKIESHMGE